MSIPVASAACPSPANVAPITFSLCGVITAWILTPSMVATRTRNFPVSASRGMESENCPALSVTAVATGVTSIWRQDCPWLQMNACTIPPGAAIRPCGPWFPGGPGWRTVPLTITTAGVGLGVAVTLGEVLVGVLVVVGVAVSVAVGAVVGVLPVGLDVGVSVGAVAVGVLVVVLVPVAVGVGVGVDVGVCVDVLVKVRVGVAVGVAVVVLVGVAVGVAVAVLVGVAVGVAVAVP